MESFALPPIPERTREVLRASVFHEAPGGFVYAKARSVARPEAFFLVHRDDREVTVVGRESALSGADILERNADDWALFAIDCASPFYCVGFLATLTALLCARGLDVLVVSTYSRDVVLVKDAEREAAREALLEAGIQAGEPADLPE